MTEKHHNGVLYFVLTRVSALNICIANSLFTSKYADSNFNRIYWFIYFVLTLSLIRRNRTD